MAAKKKKRASSRGSSAPDEMRGLPERLKRAMKAANDITQLSLQDISGVSQSSISALKNGFTLDSVTLSTVARLALALNADLDWLVFGHGDHVPRLVAAAKAGGVAVLDEAKSPPLVPEPPKIPKPRKRFPRQA